jgi:hypothetical protein
MPITLTTQEAEISPPLLGGRRHVEKPITKKGWRVTQAVTTLPSNCEALSSNPGAVKGGKNKLKCIYDLFSKIHS